MSGPRVIPFVPRPTPFHVRVVATEAGTVEIDHWAKDPRGQCAACILCTAHLAPGREWQCLPSRGRLPLGGDDLAS